MLLTLATGQEGFQSSAKLCVIIDTALHMQSTVSSVDALCPLSL